ncbi:alpha/beta hydrolase [Henriciella litoralis]|uniref:alpha/beta hydrolase n=1 Tax=Henriciella litoralis TaxID=568102 RepID=UPI000A04A597|nr:alpha/beta hydrolase [Henriciella litoralis]
MRNLYFTISSCLAIIVGACAQPYSEVPAGIGYTTVQQCEALSEQFDMTCVEVLYGTNRAWIGFEKSDDASKVFDLGDLYSKFHDTQCEPAVQLVRGEQKTFNTCHLGRVWISIPDTRQDDLRAGGGATEAVRSGSRVRPADLRSKKALLDHQHFEDQRAFAKRVGELLGESQNTKGHAVVFIHGFNVKFRNAAFSAAQLKYDMAFDGPVTFYSWPANNAVKDYLDDQIDGDMSVDALAEFLRFYHDTVKASDPDAKIHIVAHSMGTRVTMQALARLQYLESPPIFDELILAGGDLDTTLFQEWMNASRDLVRGATIYTSRYDGPVKLSTALRNINGMFGQTKPRKERIGFFEIEQGPVVYDFGDFRADVIDISSLAERSWWGMFDIEAYTRNHSSYARKVLLTDDMLVLMCSSSRDDSMRLPQERSFGAIEAVGGYWSVAEDAETKIPGGVRQGCQTPGLTIELD